MSTKFTDETAKDRDVEMQDGREVAVVYRGGPSVRPAVVKLAVALGVAVVLELYVLTHPNLFGTPEYSEITAYVVSIVMLLLLLRYAIHVYVLKRHRYVITEDAVRWQYSLFHKTRSRELPFSKIRSHEVRRDRIQSLLGYGTVAFLSGGTNRSLGHLTFENVPDVEAVRTVVRTQLRERTDEGSGE